MPFIAAELLRWVHDCGRASDGADGIAGHPLSACKHQASFGAMIGRWQQWEM